MQTKRLQLKHQIAEDWRQRIAYLQRCIEISTKALPADTSLKTVEAVIAPFRIEQAVWQDALKLFST